MFYTFRISFIFTLPKTLLLNNLARQNFSQFTVVVRSAGERTTQACKNLVINEISEEQVHIIQLTPFEEALRESYRIGLKSGREWLITIDADVLPRKGFMKKMAVFSSEVGKNVFSFKAMVYDQFFLKHRLAGFRVYRCSMLEEALTLVPANGQEIRPEQFTVNKMKQRGYKTKIFEYVVGLHDFEQYNKDIYRKAYFHATKHPDLVAENMSYWKSKSNTDEDFKVMIKGAVDGLLSKDNPKADIRFFENLAQRALEDLNMAEKPSLNTDIEFKIEKTLEEYGLFFKGHSLTAAKKRMDKYGLVKGAAHHIGFILEATGKSLRKKIENR